MLDETYLLKKIDLWRNWQEIC